MITGKMPQVSSSNGLLIDALIVIFGISSWVSINGLWVQTPLLVKSLPEAWDISSYIVLLTQFANIGPILYTVLKELVDPTSTDKLETFSIHFILALGFISCLLLSFTWHVVIANVSLPFFILATISAMVDCTSSVLYFPFVSKFKLASLRSLLFGEALSGLVPSMVALVQGVGGNPSCVNITVNGTTKVTTVYPEPLFSVDVFFIFISILMAVSWLAFYLLRHTSIAEVIHSPEDPSSRVAKRCLNEPDGHRTYGAYESDSPSTEEDAAASDQRLADTFTHHRKNSRWYLILQGYYCFLGNGVCAAIQTYSSLPYGNTTHHLATTLSAASGPVAVILCFLIHRSNNNFSRLIGTMTVISTCTAGYIICLAYLSPQPPLRDTTIGPVLIVITWILFKGCNTYAKSSVAGQLKLIGGHEAMFNYGVATQLGSLVGALLIFFIMKVFNPFHSYHPC